MRKALRFLRQASPEDRAAAYGHASWALSLVSLLFALAWVITP